MTTQSPKKADMIRSLLQAGELQEYKSETERATLQKIYRKVDTEKLKEMYAALQAKSVKTVVKEINEDVKAAVKSSEDKAMYEYVVNEDGLKMKRWVADILKEFGFSEAHVENGELVKTLSIGTAKKPARLTYYTDKNLMVYGAMRTRTCSTCKETYMLCEFISRSFIKKCISMHSTIS